MVAFALLRASLALVALLAPTTFSAPAPTKAVLTPAGYRPAEDVHAVPEGGRVVHVGDEVHLVNAAGEVVHVAKKAGTKLRDTPVGDVVDPEQSGWVAYAHWTNSGSSPISSFTTDWTVPPTPLTYQGQTVFLFNSIEPATYDAILQPVLQYGPSAAGGGGYWAVASWYVYSGGAYFTPLVRVSAGTPLHGVITLTGRSGSKYSYTSLFTGISGTSLTVSNVAQLVWATETLESYNVRASSDYPIGSTVFSAINLKTSSGTPSVTWNPVSDTADGVTTTVNAQGATNAKITIKYPIGV